MHSQAIRDRVVARVATGETRRSVSQDTGVPATTVSRWWREAGRVRTMSPSDRADDRFTAREKMRLLSVAEGLSEAELGAFLRKEGVSDAQLKRWRAEVEAALSPASRRRTDREKELERKNRELERELQRKDKALSEAAVLLVLQKKAQEIWGDAANDTDDESD